ncbi:unnamed protein product [Camellia sinensis]
MENIRSTIEIGKNLCDLTGPWVGYHNNLDTNMETLKRKIEQLNGRNNDINVEVNYKAQRITGDVQTLERQEREVRGFKNALKRAQLGKRVVDKIEEVGKLCEDGKFSDGLLIDDPTCGHAILTAESLAEPTSVRNREKIWNFLMDDAVRKIGVHGMGGVGKTTIMTSIHNQLFRTSTFSDVIWVTVSKAFDIENLQRQIAKKLNIDLSDNEDELRSASEIHNMLSQKKRYVLILDDLWKEFPLEKMGIPEPTRDNGCKLVLTTRLVDVCTKMNCRPVEMELLTEEEALNLFMNNVKEHQTTLTTDVEEIAKEVAKKCARLPLAIVVMAGCMRGVNDIHEWRNARSVRWRLGKEGLFEQLEFSYSRLKDEQERHCFLYCALYPEDHDINREELIEHWIAEGLISETNSIEAMFDEGHSILNKLIKTCLLVKSIAYGEECVKMHDLIRDMALKITSASPRFMVRAGEGLTIVPHKDWSEDLERVSLMWNHIEELPSEPPNCPRLITFLFRGNKSTEFRIQNSFFLYMPRLKVLDLSDTNIESLPDSISMLENLHQLLLNGCWQLKNVPSLEKLKALEYFELTNSQIEKVPQGIGELVNLRKLRLGANCNLKYVPSLEKLKALEHFELAGSQIEEAPQGIEELVNLRKLGFWDNCNLKYVPSLEKLKALEHFKLAGSQIEEAPQGIEELVNLRMLILHDNHNLKYVPSLEKLKALEYFGLTHNQMEEVPQGIEELVNLRELILADDKLGMSPCRKLCRLTQLHYLEIRGTKIKVSAEELLCLKQLKVLHAQFHNVQELTKYVKSGQYESLEDYSLEVGIVDESKKERLICEHYDGYFSSIGVDAVVLPSDVRKLHIKRWHNHISLSDIQSLRNARDLERFSIKECDGLESIFSSSSSCFSEEYPILGLVLWQCPKMENIFSTLLLHNFPNLEKLQVQFCKNVEEIIVEVETSDRRGHREDDGDIITLPNLKKLYLRHLPRLESIYKGIMVCESLQIIAIWDCPMLRRLPISLHMNEDGEQATAPPTLQIISGEKEWWESLEWDNPLTKTTLQPFYSSLYYSGKKKKKKKRRRRRRRKKKKEKKKKRRRRRKKKKEKKKKRRRRLNLLNCEEEEDLLKEMKLNNIEIIIKLSIRELLSGRMVSKHLHCLLFNTFMESVNGGNLWNGMISIPEPLFSISSPIATQ